MSLSSYQDGKSRSVPHFPTMGVDNVSMSHANKATGRRRGNLRVGEIELGTGGDDLTPGRNLQGKRIASPTPARVPGFRGWRLGEEARTALIGAADPERMAG